MEADIHELCPMDESKKKNGKETRTLSEDIENESDTHSVGLPSVQTRKFYYVEPILLFMCLAMSIFEAILPNAIEVQYCSAVLNIDDSSYCLNSSNPYATKIQAYASTFAMRRSFVELLVPGLLSFFVGPWSDTFGRKPLMLAASTGYLITFSLWTWGSMMKSLHPSFFILFSIPIAFSGGPVIMMLSTFCYICDVSSIEDRGTRLGLLQACFYAGSLVGSIAAPHLITEGYTVGFGIAVICVFITLTFLLFVLSESVTVSQLQRNTVSKNPFQLEQLRSLYQTCYVKQSSRTFLTLSLLILLMSLSLIQALGEQTIFYLFLQHILGWDLLQFTPLNCFTITVSAIGAWAGTWLFTKYLKLHDLYTLAISSFFRVLSALSLMFGTEIWHIYMTRVLGSSAGVFGPIVRVFLSRIIAPEDIGKVFCLIGSLESLTPLIGSVVYTALFTATLDSYPRAVFVLSGILCTAVILIVALLVKIHLRPSMDLTVPQTSSINA